MKNLLTSAALAWDTMNTKKRIIWVSLLLLPGAFPVLFLSLAIRKLFKKPKPCKCSAGKVYCDCPPFKEVTNEEIYYDLYNR